MQTFFSVTAVIEVIDDPRFLWSYACTGVWGIHSRPSGGGSEDFPVFFLLLLTLLMLLILLLELMS